MKDLDKSPEGQKNKDRISYEFLTASLEKIRAENKRYQERITLLEDKLINKYNDPETVKSDFTIIASPWDAFKAKHPGMSEHLLIPAFEEDQRWQKEIEGKNKLLKSE